MVNCQFVLMTHGRSHIKIIVILSEYGHYECLLFPDTKIYKYKYSLTEQSNTVGSARQLAIGIHCDLIQCVYAIKSK